MAASAGFELRQAVHVRPVAAQQTIPARPPRRDVRRPLRVPCRLRITCSDGQRVVMGMTLNVSAGGLAVLAAATPPLGAHIEAEISRFEQPPLLFAGRVVRCRRMLGDEYEIGLSLSPD